jgi:hypothetical protein
MTVIDKPEKTPRKGPKAKGRSALAATLATIAGDAGQKAPWSLKRLDPETGRIVRLKRAPGTITRRGATSASPPPKKPAHQRKNSAPIQGHGVAVPADAGASYVLVTDRPEVAEAISIFLPDIAGLVAEFGPEAVARQLERLREKRIAEEAAEQPAVDDPPEQDWRARQELAFARLREAFLVKWHSVSAPDLNRITSSQAKNGYQRPGAWERQGRIFSVPVSRGKLFPLFQLKDNAPRPLVQEVLAILKPALTPWQIAFWWTSANGWLPGNAAPVELIDDPQAVLEAARHEVAEIFP